MEIMDKKEIYQRPEAEMICMEVEEIMAVSGAPDRSKNPSGIGGFTPNATFWKSTENNELPS